MDLTIPACLQYYSGGIISSNMPYMSYIKTPHTHHPTAFSHFEQFPFSIIPSLVVSLWFLALKNPAWGTFCRFSQQCRKNIFTCSDL